METSAQSPYPSPVLREVLDSVWPGRKAPTVLCDVGSALALARANQVEGNLARSHPAVFADELTRVQHATAAFDANLREATALLRAEGVRPVLIKYVSGVDHVYSNFDLVVGAGWSAALQALHGWGVRTSGHPLERTKILIHPMRGPAAHVHRHASWWDVPAIDGDQLRARAHDTGLWLAPDPVDELRIWVAHAVFQNLAFDLSELMALRPLLGDANVAAAARACADEGWARAFDGAVHVAKSAVTALDDGAVLPVPVRLPMHVSTALLGHAVHLARSNSPSAAAREAVLRGPLLAAKWRATRRIHRLVKGPRPLAVVGFSGPDGAGKSSAVEAFRILAASEGFVTRRTYLYGCVVCRRFDAPASLRAPSSQEHPGGREAGDGVRGLLRGLHAHVDAAEAALRLRAVVTRVAAASRLSGRPGLVVTDRTPLDSLVKHALPPASGAARRMRRTLHRFTTLALLDASGAELARRDGEHSADHLERARDGYRRWSTGIPPVMRLCSGGTDAEELARTVLAVVLRRRTPSMPQATASDGLDEFSG